MAEKEKEKKKTAPAAASLNPDKKKALETAIAKIERDYGKGTIMRLGDDIPVNVEALSTGSLSLDLALGIGGVPKGRIVEIYGPEASGKTTLALHVVASAQKAGGEAAYIDVEHALEPAYARALGVDIDSLLISQPDTGEQALDITESLVRSGAVDVVVVDSVAALIPRTELEGEIGDSVVGVLARLMSQAMRRLAGAISKNNCTVIFINQLRQKIGVMYGNPETTPGGLA
ncbi:MAG: recombinase RecA, partial [Eubacteriales bacterium]